MKRVHRPEFIKILRSENPQLRLGSLGYTKQTVRLHYYVGTRRTSWRRRNAVNLVAAAHTLAAAAGKDPIDRHKPYVYGASSQKARRAVLQAYLRLQEGADQ